jgi:hypothetical protein
MLWNYVQVQYVFFLSFGLDSCKCAQFLQEVTDVDELAIMDTSSILHEKQIL